MTVRLDDGLAAELATVAEVDGRPASEVVRLAVREHIRTRQRDPAFRALLRAHIGKAQRLLSIEVR